MEDWEEEINRGFLKVDEGVHIIEVMESPVKRTNNFGNEQWMFEEAKVDGVRGAFTPPKGLLRLISQVKQDSGDDYPVTLKVKRIGMKLDTKFVLITELDTE